MRNPTNLDLQVLLARIEERQIAVVDKLDNITARQKEHEEKDEKRFESLNRYAASISIVSAFVGALFTYGYNKIKDFIS